MASLFFLLLLILLVAGPIIWIAKKSSAVKEPSEPLSPEQKAGHAKAARNCFLFSIGAAVVLYLFSPLLPVNWDGGDRDSYLGLADGWLSFLLRTLGLVLLFASTAKGITHVKLAKDFSGSKSGSHIFMAVLGHFSFLAWCGAAAMNMMGGLAWGRPLRVSGKIVKPCLQAGDDWAHGDRPDATGLDDATKRALEALWLHDAKKEYASVPAFSRLGWEMAALAAPPELLRDIHIAAIQEIDHARKCFALAAGFGAHAWSVLPIPEMLNDTGRLNEKPFVTLATESLSDGCLLEGFNADIADKSALICRDAASLKVIRQIAREERAHAELSWRVLAFCFQSDPHRVGSALRSEMDKLAGTPRPTASSSQNIEFINEANDAALQAYGRLPDTEFDAIWWPRVEDTQQRLLAVLSHAMSDESNHLAPQEA